MAKSISGGLGTVNLSVQELRLLGGTFTTLDTTTLTVLGTATLGSLTINGTFTLDQLTANTIQTVNLTVSETMAGNLTGNVTGDLTGNVTGDLTGDVTGNLVGNVTGNVTGNLTGNVTATDITASGTITANGNIVVSSLPVDNDDNTFRYIPFQGANNILHKDSKLMFRPTTNTFETFNITCENITTTNITATTDNTSIRALNNTTALASRIPFINGTEAGVLVSRDNFNYNPSTETMNVGTINTTQDISIGDDLSVVGSTSLGSGLKIQTLNTIISETCRLLCWNNAGSLTSKPVVNKDVLYYVGSSDTLHTPNITASGNVGAGSITTTSITSTSFNSQTVISPTITSSVMINAFDIKALGELTVTCPITTLSDNNRVAFIEAKAIDGTTDYGQGILSRGNLFYNNDNQTLFCQNLWGQVLVYTPKLRVTPPSGGFVAGEFTIDGANGLAAQHASSFCVKVNSVKQVQISSTQTTFFNDVVMNNDLTINGNTVFTNVVANEFRNTFSNLPIGYTATYSCSQYDTVNGTFGMDDSILLNYEASQGGTPTVHQFGGNVTLMNGIVFIRSPIDFGQSSSGQYWRLNGWQSSPTTNQNYVGCWEVTVFAIFQNLSQSRITPKIKLLKYNGVSYEEQTQVTSSTGYTKNGNGSIISMVCNGVVKMTSISRLQLWTRADVNSIPVNTTYPDTVSSTDWTGIDLNISMKYLGFQINISHAL